MELMTAGDHLEHDKHNHDRNEGHHNLFRIMGECRNKLTDRIPGIHNITNDRFRGSSLRLKADAQNQNGQDRADAAKSNQAKAVIRGFLITADGHHTNTQGHNKRYGNRAGGHSAGVKCGRNKIRRGKSRQHKYYQIKYQQQPGQRNAQSSSQKGYYQKQTYADSHGQNQHHIGNGGDLFRQHGQIRLGDGDDHAKRKADDHG